MKHLILDIGGVFHLGKTDKAFWGGWARRGGLDATALEHGFWHGPDIEAANIGLIDHAEYCARSSVRIGLSADFISDLVWAAFASDFNTALAARVQAWRADGVPVSALSNSWSSEAAIQARPEFAGLFDHVLSSRDVGLTKPDPAIYRLSLERLGIAAGEAVFVDDTLGHVEAARALGMHGVHFQDTRQAVKEIDGLLI